MELETLVKASRAGDTGAFGRIVAMYQRLVCSVAYSQTGDVQQSEDIAQETFVAAWQRLADLREPGSIAAWLCGIARNKSRTAFRRQQRDPLAGAAPLDLEHDSPLGVEPVSLNETDRLALVWETLSGIPEEYREPLVLFYREGQSVREVALAMELSEDAVKQRLSRGRKMLKAEVARIVEETLEQTAPGPAFTSSVMAAIPLSMGPMGLAASITGGGAATGKAVSAVPIAAALGGFAGALVGATGGFFGMWKGIQNSPTLRMRRVMLACAHVTYAFVWLFLGYEAMCGVLFWQEPSRMFLFAGAGWVLYVPLLLILIVASNRWGMRVAREDAGILPAPAVPLEQSALSRRWLWTGFAVSLALAIIGSLAVVMWIHGMPATRAMWPMMLGVAAIIHFVYVAIFRKGMAIAHDEAAFQSCPPSLGLEEMLSHRGPLKEANRRAQFFNDFGALAGTIFGPMAPALGASVSAGHYIATGVMFALSLAGFVFGLWMRQTPTGRIAGFAWVCVYMGVVCGVSTGLAGRVPISQGIVMEAYWVGLIPLALYWCMAIALTIVKRRA